MPSLAVLAVWLLAAAAAWYLIDSGRSAAGTTLIAVWGWCWAPLAAVVICETVIWVARDLGSHAWAGHARYLAAICSLAPGVSLLGAKRPQSAAWPIITAALLPVLALPAAADLLVRRSTVLEPGAFWMIVLALLWAEGAANYLFTRFFLASLLWAAAQAVWLHAAARSETPAAGGVQMVIGMALATAALAIRAAGWPVPRATAADGSERWWRDFHDQFGTLWSARVAERFNEAARAANWPATLGRDGGIRYSDLPARSASEGVPPADRFTPPMRKQLRSLLRRFVSPEWLEARNKRRNG